MKTISIGTRIEYSNITLEVVEAYNTENPCKGCFFDKALDCYKNPDLTGSCGSADRDDMKDVIFKKVE